MKGQFVIGLVICCTGAILNSLGNVLFKFHEVKQEKDATYSNSVALGMCFLNWYWAAILTVFIGNGALAVAYGFLPLSIHSVFAAFPIVLGELFSGFLLPHSKLDRTQWLIIAFMCVSMVGVFISGDHSESDSVAPEFESSMRRYYGQIFVATWALILCVSGYILLFMNKPATLHPASIYNISGPVFTAAVGTLVNVCARMIMVIIKCKVGDDCDNKETSNAYYSLLFIFPVSALIQLLSLAYTMGKLHLVSVIPLYCTLLVIWPSLAGLVLLQEEPGYLPSYVFFTVLIIICNILFVHITSKKRESRGDPLYNGKEGISNYHSAATAIVKSGGSLMQGSLMPGLIGGSLNPSSVGNVAPDIEAEMETPEVLKTTYEEYRQHKAKLQAQA